MCFDGLSLLSPLSLFCVDELLCTAATSGNSLILLCAMACQILLGSLATVKLVKYLRIVWQAFASYFYLQYVKILWVE